MSCRASSWLFLWQFAPAYYNKMGTLRCGVREHGEERTQEARRGDGDGNGHGDEDGGEHEQGAQPGDGEHVVSPEPAGLPCTTRAWRTSSWTSRRTAHRCPPPWPR